MSCLAVLTNCPYESMMLMYGCTNSWSLIAAEIEGFWTAEEVLLDFSAFKIIWMEEMPILWIDSSRVLTCFTTGGNPAVITGGSCDTQDESWNL